MYFATRRVFLLVNIMAFVQFKVDNPIKFNNRGIEGMYVRKRSQSGTLWKNKNGFHILPSNEKNKKWILCSPNKDKLFYCSHNLVWSPDVNGTWPNPIINQLQIQKENASICGNKRKLKQIEGKNDRIEMMDVDQSDNEQHGPRQKRQRT